MANPYAWANFTVRTVCAAAHSLIPRTSVGRSVNARTDRAPTFAANVAGIDTEGPYEDAFFKAGCDDATIVVRDGVIQLDFEREASSFAAAAGSACTT